MAIFVEKTHGFNAIYRFHELYLAGLTDDWMKIKDGSSLSSSPYPTTTSWRLLLMAGKHINSAAMLIWAAHSSSSSSSVEPTKLCGMREQYYLEKLTTMPEIQGAWGVKNGSDATKPIISNTMPVSILAVFLISIAY